MIFGFEIPRLEGLIFRKFITRVINKVFLAIRVQNYKSPQTNFHYKIHYFKRNTIALCLTLYRSCINNSILFCLKMFCIKRTPRFSLNVTTKNSKALNCRSRERERAVS